MRKTPSVDVVALGRRMDCRPLVDAGSFFVAVLWVSGIRTTSRSLRTCSRTKQPTGSGSGDRYTTPRPPSSVGAAFSVAAIGQGQYQGQSRGQSPSRNL
jgi:hypothetical protein